MDGHVEFKKYDRYGDLPTNEAMARMIGSVRVIVNRHLQDFMKMGLISTSRGELVVRDLEKLRMYCERLLAK